MDRREWSLPLVRDRSADAFVTWRYIYEATHVGAPVPFDFHTLDVAANVLHERAVHFLDVLEARPRNENAR